MEDVLKVRAEVREGTRLKDKWLLDALLGIGGVATVYAATHRNGSRAAIKILHPEYAGDPEIRGRFLREGYAANAVEHSGVVHVLDDDQTDDGLVFVVMELLSGETLEQRAGRHGGALPAVEVLVAAAGMLSVLAAAHGKSVFHRDLKPDNVFLTEEGALKVLDFGLARVRPPLAATTRSTTRVGWMMGTPGFMPPEQVRGQWDQVDARSDLWAVGATMYALLTGRQVHGDAPEDEALLAALQPVPSLGTVAPRLPAPVVAIVDRALQVERAARWQSAVEMREAVLSALEAYPDRPAWTSGAPLTSPRATAAKGAPPATTTTRKPPRGQAIDPGESSVTPARRAADNLEAIEIAPDTYWVGKRDPGSIFHANPYLRVFRPRGGEGAPFHLLVDPGSSSDFAVVSAKLRPLIGGIGRISAMFINHQDPDVGSSAAVISARHAPAASILCSEATWRLIVHQNLPRERFVDVGGFARGYPVPTGHVVIPVPSPFCHFRGAVMLYDPETRVLFSGDLFGGITASGAPEIWADDGDWSGVRAFHQTYMPETRALARAVAAIRALDPPVAIIAPQHGRLLRGPLIARTLSRIERLPVGLDVMDDEGGPAALAAWSSVLRRVIATARMILGGLADERLAADDSLRDTLSIEGDAAAVTGLGRWTIGAAVGAVTRGELPAVANPIKLEAIFACEELELPTPDLRIEADEGGRG
jgi:serine/threonine-protein kinase